MDVTNNPVLKTTYKSTEIENKSSKRKMLKYNNLDYLCTLLIRTLTLTPAEYWFRPR